MTPGEAFSALTPIVGSGGLIGALLAYLGYRQQASRGRPDPAPLTVTLASSSPMKSADMELVANAMSNIGSAITRSNILAEYRICVAAGDDGAAFKKWLEHREMEEALAAFKAQKPRP
jgi:hypothetical protein